MSEKIESANGSEKDKRPNDLERNTKPINRSPRPVRIDGLDCVQNHLVQTGMQEPCTARHAKPNSSPMDARPNGSARHAMPNGSTRHATLHCSARCAMPTGSAGRARKTAQLGMQDQMSQLGMK